MSVGAGGRQLTNLMNKNYKEENYEREVERQQLESTTPWHTNIISVREPLFHRFASQPEAIPHSTLIGSPTHPVYTDALQ